MKPWDILKEKIASALLQLGLAIFLISLLSGCTRGNGIVVVTPETYQKQLKYYNDAQGDSYSSPPNTEHGKQQTTGVTATYAQQELNGTITSRPLTNRERKEQALLWHIPYEEMDEKDEQEAQSLYALQQKQRREKAAEEYRERKAMEALAEARQRDDGTQSTGINWLGIAAGMQAAGAGYQGNYSVPQQYQQVPQGSSFNSATIIRPGQAPSYYSGDKFGGSLITPGQPASQFSHDGMGGTTIITPGQPPVYIERY